MYKIYDVFISYRRMEEDGAPLGLNIAQAIYSYLTGKGLRVFFDKEKMETGRFDKQLEWQVTRAPNYIFVATPGAMHFRKVTPPDVDYVAEEIRLALKLYNEDAFDDKALIPIIPYGVDVPTDSDGIYPPEVHELFKHDAGKQLTAQIPTEDDLEQIFEKVSEVKRRNLWNAGQRWYEESTKDGRRFASLNIDQIIMPLANTQDRSGEAIPFRAHLESEPDKPLMEMIKSTSKHLYLIGEGGIGKTTALYSIMQKAYGPGTDEDDIDRNRLDGQVPLFIELSHAPDTYGELYYGGKSTFIHRSVYQQIRTDLKMKQISAAATEGVAEVFKMDPATAVLPIRNLFTQQTPSPEYLLLLDGLNEVSRTEITWEEKEGGSDIKTGKASVVSMICEEICELTARCPNVRVILTSRSKETIGPAEKTTVLFLSGIDEKNIQLYLLKRSVSPLRIEAALKNEKLREILRIPLFLTLYGSLKGEEQLSTRGEILNVFFHQKKETLYTIKKRNQAIEADMNDADPQAKQAERMTAEMQSFILDFIVPEIAWWMVGHDRFHIDRKLMNAQDSLDSLILNVLKDRSDTAICGRYGINAFTDYWDTANAGSSTAKTAEKITSALSGDAVIEELTERINQAVSKGLPIDPGWIRALTKSAMNGNNQDKTIHLILNYIVMMLGILQLDGSEYSFVHQYIRDYFAAVYQINRLRVAVEANAAANGEAARMCMGKWGTHPLPAEIRRFIGEVLGIGQGAGPRKEKRGQAGYGPQSSADPSLLDRAFDLYRGRFDGTDGYCVWNILEIWKDARTDLSGLDLSELDLSLCELNGYTLGDGKQAAKFLGAKISDSLFFLKGHSGFIRAAAFSPDSKYIATLSDDEHIKIWDRETAQVVQSYSINSGNTYASHTTVRFSSDGKYLAAAYGSKLGLWKTRSWKQLAVFHGHKDNIRSVDFSADNQFILTASADKTAKVWNLDKILSIEEGFPDYPIMVEVYDTQYDDPNQKMPNDVASYNKKTDTVIFKTYQRAKTLYGHTSAINTAAFSHDGQRIITASDDQSIILWNAISNEPIIKIQTKDRAKSAVYHPDDQIAFVTLDDPCEVFILDAKTCKIISTGCRQESPVQSVDVSPDGKNLLTASWNGEIKLWSSDGCTELSTLEITRHIAEFARYSPDGRYIVFAERNNSAVIIDTFSLQKTGVLQGRVGGRGEWDIAYTPDMRRIITVSQDHYVYIWDPETFRLVKLLKGHQDEVDRISSGLNHRYFSTTDIHGTTLVWDKDTLQSVAVLHNAYNTVCGSRYIFAKQNTGGVCVWDVNSMKLIGVFGNDVTGYAVSPDESHIFISHFHTEYINFNIMECRGTDYLTVWDVNACKCVFKLEGTGNIFDVKYSPDGKYFACSGNNGLRIWDAVTFDEIQAPVTEARVRRFVFDKNRRWLLTSYGDRFVQLWDGNTLELVKTFTFPRNFIITGIEFSQDGNFFITAGQGETMVWSTKTLEKTAETKYSNKKASFSPDDKHILTTDIFGAEIYDAANYKSEHSFCRNTGLDLVGIDLRHIHPESTISDRDKQTLYMYGAIV